MSDKSGHLKCRNIGCREIFKWREQLKRHKTKCSFPPKDVITKYKRLQDDTFQCQSCDQVFSKQSNVSRHIKKGCKRKEIKFHECTVCSKVFAYKSILDRHVKIHEKVQKSSTEKVHVCKVCSEVFAAKGFLDRHVTNTHEKVKKPSRDRLNDFIPSQVFVRSDHSQSHSSDIAENSAYNYGNNLADDGNNLNSTSPLFDIDLVQSDHISETVPDDNQISESVIFNDSVSVHDDEINLNSSSVSADFSKLPSVENSADRKGYYKLYRQKQRKTANLENIIRKLESPQKRAVVCNVSRNLGEVIAFTDSSSIFEARLCQSLISYLKNLWKQGSFIEFHKLLDKLFPEHLDDEEFLRWLAGKLELSKKIRLKQSIEKCRHNEFKETRGRNKSNWQAVYDMWLECSIPSTDGRNGRNMVNIKKRQYLPFAHLTSDDTIVETRTNKRGSIIYSASRRIATVTVRGLQQKLMEAGLNISLGTIVYLKPFFINYPSEKELALCLCKLCLNSRLLFTELMKEEKRNGGEAFNSITNYFMNNCECPKLQHGSYSWACVNGKCKSCKNLPLPKLVSEDVNAAITFSQFELTETPYTRKDKVTGEVVEKLSKKPERVHHTFPFADALQQFNSLKHKYLAHKFQVYNDIYHWPQILSTTDFGPIYHMDYSENLCQSFKYEPQSTHFNKNQYSLHCTVKHGANGNRYIYHLSDELSHNFAYTYCVVSHVISLDPNYSIIRLKSDNCSTQYKCKYVFGKYKELAMEKGVPVIVYFGASGHGKGLVDAMSGFGVKGPLRRAVVTQDLHYDSASDIVSFLSDLFHDDIDKIHYELTVIEIDKVTKSVLKIKDIMKQHMISFFPDGSVQMKINMCSCESCLTGHFITCVSDPGVQVCSKLITDSDSESESDDDFCYDDEEEEHEEQQIRGSCIIELLERGKFIALFSPPSSSELFYLCKVLDYGVASETFEDTYHHVIPEGSSYIKCQYLEKKDEKKNKIIYKLLSNEVFVLPPQVMSPLVPLKEDLSITIGEYQWLSDMI